MKNRYVLFFCVLLLIIILSCSTELPANLSSFFSFDGVDFDTESDTLDFGVREVDGTGSIISGVVKNLSDSTVIVTAVSLNDTENYALTSFELPFELAPGGNAEFSLSFTPLSAGTKAAALYVTFSAATEATMTVNITGKGNEAPEAVFGIDVSGASEYPEVNGFYLPYTEGETWQTHIMSGTTDYFIYVFMSDGYFWAINDTFDTSRPQFVEGRTGARCFIGPFLSINALYSPPEVIDNEEDYWRENYIGYPSITVKTGITKDGDTLSSNHHYSDPDNDAEAGTKYRWLKGDTFDGTYTEVPGETTDSIDVSADHDKFFKLEVTPIDVNGFEGPSVESVPYYVEEVILVD